MLGANCTEAQKEMIVKALTVSQLAKQCGYSCEVGKGGKMRLTTVKYDRKGVSTVTRHSDWLTSDEALARLTAQA